MKKYFLLICLLTGAVITYAQDLNEIKKLIILKQYVKAKPLVDSYLAVEKNAATADGWYYKAFVDNSLGRDETKSVAERKALYESALNAIKKYAQLDAKATLTKEEENGTIFNIYYGFYDLGIKTYNEKNYPESYELFKKTLDVHDHIHNGNLAGYQGLKFSAHDTDVVWNLVVLANELKKKDEAVDYYKKIVAAELSDEKYVTAYDDLIVKARREKDAAAFNKYLELAKKFYPVDKPYWENQQIEFVVADLEDEALLNKYEELLAQLPDNYIVPYNYAVEIDRFLGSSASTGKDKAMYRKKMEDLFKKAITIKSTIEANLQLANIYYSKTFDLQEQAARIKGTKPDEVKLKKELNENMKAAMAAAVPYAEEAAKLLGELKEYKFAEKANYKLALEILSNAAKLRGDTVKMAEYEKKKATIDSL